MFERPYGWSNIIRGVEPISVYYTFRKKRLIAFTDFGQGTVALANDFSMSWVNAQRFCSNTPMCVVGRFLGVFKVYRLQTFVT